MEYSVGSLADLISGTKTLNKTKIVTKEFKKREKSKSDAASAKVGPQIVKSDIKVSSVDRNVEHLKKNGKKRKQSPLDSKVVESELEQSPPKRQKLTRNKQNALNRIEKKVKKETKNPGQFGDRTVFVGNIPIHMKKKKIKKHFKKYGIIETVRIRGIPVADIKTPKKVAAIKKEYHPDRNTVYAFIRFANPEDAQKAQEENGELLDEHHLRVQLCESNKNSDESKAIFVGNLTFDAEEEELWKLFSPCGPISHVRIVRDRQTGIGKGFGYVNFKDSDSVQLALEMEKVTQKNRELRISTCDSKHANKKKLDKKPRKIKETNAKNASEQNAANEMKNPIEKKTKVQFRGSQFNNKKKKKKYSKSAIEKKKLAEKLTAVKSEVKKE